MLLVSFNCVAGLPAQPPQAKGSATQEVATADAVPTRVLMTAADLVSQLNQPEASLKSHILKIQNASISGDVVLGLEQLPVPFRVEFQDCEFLGNVVIKSVVFDESLVFNNVTFDKAFQLENTHIKGDLLLTNVRMDASQPASQAGKKTQTKIRLNQSQVDGDVRIKNPGADLLEAENLVAGNLIVYVSKSGSPALDFIKLSTGRLSIAAGEDTRTSQLQLDGGTIHETATLQNLTLTSVTAPNLTVGKRTVFLPKTVIEKQLDLSFSSLGNFDWEFPGDARLQLPATLTIEGVTFSNLHVAPVFTGTAKSSAEREGRWKAKRTDYGLGFLEKAAYFEPAYTTYQAQLVSQGRSDAAEAVYFAMRDRRRYTEWKDSATFSGRAVAGINYVIGFGHKWLFGYGRSWVYPVVWCLAFVGIGAFAFRDVTLMEKQDTQPAPPFSPLLYSIDLLLPVLSLGVTAHWRPKGDQRFLLFYSKLLTLMGLVFLSAALATLTNSLK
jgi:hypothetical protein